jgi:hypothetical protein
MSDTDALTKIIELLRPLNTEDRRRIVEAALVFLGGTPTAAERTSTTMASAGEDVSYPDQAKKWMEQHSVSPDELDRVFHLPGDGSFDIHDAPGKSKKEKTLNTYVLTGLGKFLTTGDRTFENAMARGFYEKIGCYDQANHAVHLKKNKGGEFSGDKNKGYTLTSVGMKRGAALVKELAGAAK